MRILVNYRKSETVGFHLAVNLNVNITGVSIEQANELPKKHIRYARTPMQHETTLK